MDDLALIIYTMSFYLLPLSKNRCYISTASLIFRWSVLSPSKAGVSTFLLTCAVEIQHLFLERGSIIYWCLTNYVTKEADQ